jgi:2-oxoglutarate ferredoxin oxidoreductase subunit beta
MKRTLQNYKSIIEPVWCPGCGDYGVLRALEQALLSLEIPPEDIVAVSGIGCSGRLSHYVNAYSLHGTHGRAVPTATGIKAARPDLTVFAVGGDGDGLGIGGGHIVHAARKNVDITYLLLDNRIYGLTKGQASPTTPVGNMTKTTPHGVYEDPMNPVAIFLAYDVSFIARTSSFQVKELSETIRSAVEHRGFSIVYVISPCKTYPALDPKQIRSIMRPLPEDHSRTDKMGAMAKAYSTDPMYTGIFYQVRRPVLEDRLQGEIEKSPYDAAADDRTRVREVLYSFA